MLRNFLMGSMMIILGGCSSFSESEIIMKAHPDKRNPKPNYMPPEEKPLEVPPEEKKFPPFSPRLGIKIPLEK